MEIKITNRTISGKVFNPNDMSVKTSEFPALLQLAQDNDKNKMKRSA